MKNWSLAVAVMFAATVAGAAVSPDVFYVYADKGSVKNHYVPSGWMGDYGDLKLDDGNREKPQSGTTAIKFTYTGEMKEGAGWTGVFWQHPANNWGKLDGVYNLSEYKKLTFWARGAKGEEYLSEIKVGGITGDYSDSDSAVIGPVTLTKDWKKYTIDLTGKDMTKIIGGFCWSAARDANPDGFVIYFDEIRFEK